MYTLIRRCAAAAAALALVPVAFATSSEIVSEVKGHPDCEDLSNNDAIIEAVDYDPPSRGGTASVEGPDGQVFTYSVDASGELLDWETSASEKPVNFTVLGGVERRKHKRRKVSQVFHFGVDGVFSDTEEEIEGKLKVVRFCYGLMRPEPPDMINLGDCEELMRKQGKLNGSEIVCPAKGEERALISLDITPPAHPDDRKDFTVQFCTCNFQDPDTGSSRLPQCDPALSRDPDDENNACTNNPDGTNTRVPVLIQGVENPSSYICFTSGGRRVCYGHF